MRSCKGKRTPRGACERCRDLEYAALLAQSGHAQDGLHGNHTGGDPQRDLAALIRGFWRDDDAR